jgi:Flp pilus assembly protein TadB
MVPVAASQQFSRSRRSQPVLITEARPSVAEEHAARKKRYAITMAVRAVCIILAAVFYHVIWLMALFAVLGTVLPWVAVVMASDVPPKKRVTIQRPPPPADHVLESPPPARVIDG